MVFPILRVRASTKIQAMLLTSGAATLSWEVLWQIRACLSLGVSARGTALTLAVTMGGMGLGAILMAKLMEKRAFEAPLTTYGVLEILIGVAGLFLNVAFRGVATLDTAVYAVSPESAALIHVLAIAAVLGVPTLCMGATFPVFGLIARDFKVPLGTLYGLNTLGAAAGTLAAAFLFIPALGLNDTGLLIAALNLLVGLLALAGQGFVTRRDETPPRKIKGPSDFIYLIELARRFSVKVLKLTPSSVDGSRPRLKLARRQEEAIVLVSGFTTLMLEVAWFRSITAAFQSTTYAFAIMLSAVLIALGQAARQVPEIKRKQISLGSILCWAAIFIFVTTPLIERFDIFLNWNNHIADAKPAASGLSSISPGASPAANLLVGIMSVFSLLNLFIMSYLAVGIPMLFLGVAFPWVLDQRSTPRRLGKLYAFNTFAAILGSLSAGWIFLPTIGSAKTACLAGFFVLVAGVWITPHRRRQIIWGGLGSMALMGAVLFDSGVGVTRAQGAAYFSTNGQANRLLEFYQGPDSTTSVSEDVDGRRVLIIDGSSASGQSGSAQVLGAHYLTWMGSLPMLLAKDPKNALVICFGTGQTANAVRNENPANLDIVDINPSVFKLAHNFDSNQKVLEDDRVHAVVMDGRAYMRRSPKTYDVITLEPMPPNLAGVNALYSREFYLAARQRLSAGGVIAQWLPINTITPHFAASIARTFKEVFPNAIMWMDPLAPVGILLGSTDDLGAPLGTTWPGFDRTRATRNMAPDEIKKAVLLDAGQLAKYSAFGDTITDDNQLLAYGKNVQSIYVNEHLLRENVEFLDTIVAAPGP